MKFKLPKIFISLEDNSELMKEAMTKYQEEHNLGDEELKPLIEDQNSEFYKYLKKYSDEKAKEQKEQEKEAKKAEKEAKKKQETEDKTTKTTNFLEAIGGGDDPYDTSVLEKVYKKYGSYIDKFNDKKKLPVQEKQDEINNYFDKKNEEKGQGGDTEDNEGNKKSTLDKVKSAFGTAGKAIGRGAGAFGSAVSTGVGSLSKKLSHKNRFAGMKAKYDEFAKKHNKFLLDYGTDPIEKDFANSSDENNDNFNKANWLKGTAPLNLNNKTEIEKYQELADKILSYYDGGTKNDYHASIYGNIDYYNKTNDQAGKAKAIESIEQLLNNLFLNLDAVLTEFSNYVTSEKQPLDEKPGSQTEEQTEDNLKKGKLSKAKKVVGKAGSAVVEKGKAAGRGAKVLGNALLDKASDLKRTVGKKLKRKKSTPEAATPQASASETDSKAVIVQGADKKVTKEDVKNRLLKVTDRYNRFLENYKKFAKKNKHSLKEILKSVLPEAAGRASWYGGGKDKEFDSKSYKLDDIGGLQEAWDDFTVHKLLNWLSGDKRIEFEGIFTGISKALGGQGLTDDKKLEIMQLYDVSAERILRYMQAVLARLNSTASEGIVGRALKAMTKDDEGTREQEGAQEQKPRNLEEAFHMKKETDDEGKKELKDINSSQVSKAFQKAAEYFKEDSKDSKDSKYISKYDITRNKGLVDCFSGIKRFQSAISSALKSTSLGAWSQSRKGANGEEIMNSSTRHSAMGVILISMAYLPGGSESILNACDGLKIGGIKATGGDDVITNASKVRKEIKKLALKGATGDKLVNKLKSSNAKTNLEGLIDINALKQIMSKFGKWAKLERKAVNEKEKAGKKIKGLKTAYSNDGVKGLLKKINPFSKSKNKKGSKSDEQSQNENV